MPVNLLPLRLNCCSDNNDPILLGIASERLLPDSDNVCNNVNKLTLPGIVPCRLLVSRSKYVNDANDPILLGIVPVNDRLTNIIDMTLSYAADPLTVPHVTPW